MKKYISIYGPTASGKTDLSLKIAANMTGAVELVNFDSCQFLNYLPSLTMKPAPSHYGEHLFGIVGPEDSKYNAAKFIQQVKIIEENSNTNKIFVGGSGFYLLCLLNGMSNQAIDPHIMAHIEHNTMEDNYNRLCLLDAHHGLHSNDHYRIKNHLHFLLKNTSSINTTLDKPVIDKKNMFNIFLNPSKQWLHSNMEKRTNLMFPHMLQEVMHFNNIYSNFKTNIIGYNEIMDCLNGKISESMAKDVINLRTRQYAKTQVTFLKNKLTSHLVIDENYNLSTILQHFHRH